MTILKMNLFVKISVLSKIALAITGIIQGTSRENIYQKVGLELPKSRRWYKSVSCVFEIK